MDPRASLVRLYEEKFRLPVSEISSSQSGTLYDNHIKKEFLFPFVHSVISKLNETSLAGTCLLNEIGTQIWHLENVRMYVGQPVGKV